MRHRVTILNHEQNHDNIIGSVNSTYLHLNDVNYTREDRFSMEFKNKFQYIKQLRISAGNFDSPVFHYNTMGLTIYAVPSTSNKHDFFSEINPFLMNLFKIDIQDSNWILSKNALLLHIPQYEMSPMNKLLMELTNIKVQTDVVDFLYDSDKLVVSFINTDRSAIIKSSDPSVYEEIGIFLIDDNSTADDMILSGLRVVLGEESPLFKTLFHIKPRFRSVSTTSEVIRNGLHPKVKTTISSKQAHPSDPDVMDCKLYYYLTLSKSLFIDKYDLGDNFKFVLNFGNNDLELPEYKINEWGNEVLLEVSDWSKDMYLNLHSRERNILQHNPFINDFPIGNKYAQFFTNDTIFYESITNAKLQVDIPVPNKDFELVGLITSVSLAVGLLIIILQLLNTKTTITKKKLE
ncbi:protease B nonderepressible form [Yamadazyma tenuis]|uniref:protease B nonderepressible form n=1 Tax=Candida tenuis TaxID=2315449 RepID=UPI0027A6B05C|nr:protease B nonderepressible form [Yamadazyma tenuis]